MELQEPLEPRAIGAYLRSTQPGRGRNSFAPERIHCRAEVDSTNEEARRLISAGWGAGTVVTAERQTAGKGRLGRSWQSEDGAGLWFSAILEPEVSPEYAAQYSFVAAVATAQAVRMETDLAAKVKWPNDVLLDGRKLCGILLEFVPEQSLLIAGIGINMRQKAEDFPPDVREKATSLALAGAADVDRARLLGAVLRQLEDGCRVLAEEGFAAIRDRWMALSCVIGRQIRVQFPQGRTERGVAEGLDEDGALLLRTEGGRVRILSGDVSLRAEDGSYFLA